ncbi:MAG: HAD-IIIC family phosphatase [Alphaproteobacteria bacterium]
MKNRIYQDLAWLPEISKPLKDRLRDKTTEDKDLASLLLQFSKQRLDNMHLNMVAKLYDKIEKNLEFQTSLSPFKLAILSTSTFDLISPALKATALRYNISLSLIETPFNQLIAETSDPQSKIYTTQPDAILFAIDPYSIFDQPNAGVNLMVEETIGLLNLIKSNMQKNGANTTCVFQNIPHIPDALFGHSDYRMVGTFRNAINAINNFLSDDFLDQEDILIDVAHIAETVGLNDWHDPAFWHMAKLPFSQNFVPLYADHVCRVIAALKGKSKKCLVLDLDNTLWGGVIGDDGLENIRIGQGDTIGEAYTAIQKMAKSLRDRGIILAVCSKNEDSIARNVFQKHPEMVLKEKDISVFQANWNDKASNITAIAKTLNIGTDSLVFMDDNPAEREIIRQNLPEVCVPELPEDPSYYPRYIYAAGYFESLSFSEEDKKRADLYAQNTQRIELKNSIPDYDTYLQSLSMEAKIEPFDSVNMSRISQLINKTNQFNLTTRRYTEKEVIKLTNNPDTYTLQARLIDRFGDNGIVSAIICRIEGKGKIWNIDTWLMSCRVLKRRLEEAVLQRIIQDAQNSGAETLIGTYIPTDRNALVQNHYKDLGFKKGEEGEHVKWTLNLEAYQPANLPIKTLN